MKLSTAVYALMYDDAKKEIFVQKFTPEIYRIVSGKSRTLGKPYPTVGFESYKKAKKEAVKLSKRAGYTYCSERDYLDD